MGAESAVPSRRFRTVGPFLGQAAPSVHSRSWSRRWPARRLRARRWSVRSRSPCP